MVFLLYRVGNSNGNSCVNNNNNGDSGENDDFHRRYQGVGNVVYVDGHGASRTTRLLDAELKDW